MQAFAPTDAAAWTALARRAEDLGYSTLLVSDHVLYPQLGPLAAMATAAAVTERLRVGTLVLANDFRHPAVLAKELATIDVLSGGRLEIGIGAGWAADDYRQLGLPYDTPAVRIERLGEALTVLKGLLSATPFSFSGAHYTVEAMSGSPVPVQRPHPPLLVGGGGPRMLALAGREADIVGVNGQLTAYLGPQITASMTAARVDERIARLREAAGERFAALELNVNIYFHACGPDARALAKAMAPALGLEADEVLDSPHALFGTTDDMAAVLVERRDRWGFTYITVQEAYLDAFAPVVAELAGC